MASIRKKGDLWLAEVRTKGRYKSKLHNTKAEAQAWAIMTEHQFGRSGGVLSGKTLGDAMQRYRAEVTPGKKGARWEDIRLTKLLRDDISHIQLSDLRPDDFQQWVERQAKAGLGPASINRELQVFSAVLSTARKRWKWMDSSPLADVDRPRNPPPRDRRISAEEIARILKALEYDESSSVHTPRQIIAVAFLLALETAMRQGELWGLEWERVNLGQRFVTLPETKNGSKRDVALSTRAVELFGKLKPGKGRVFMVNQASAGTIFRRAVELAGIKDLTFHDCRHEAITRLARKLDVLDLARMVGHRDLRSLRVYYNPTAAEIAERLD